MIRWVATYKIVKGKNVQMVQWVTDFLKFLKKYSALPTVDVFTNIIGEGGVLSYVVDYEDFTALDKVFKQLAGDPEYAQYVSTAADLVVEGSEQITIMNKI
jgi:hypothetical protein